MDLSICSPDLICFIHHRSNDLLLIVVILNNDHIDNNDQLENNDNIMISLIDQEIVTAEDTIAVDLLHNFLISRKYSLINYDKLP